MKLPHSHPLPARTSKRGAALLLSVMVLFVLIAIVFQIRISTMTDARIGRNDVGLTLIDRAIASAQWDVMEMLKLDGEGEGGGAGAGAGEAGPAGAAAGEAGIEGQGGGQDQPADSRKDEWATVQRTDINGIDLRIIVEAENAKYNVLNLLNEDEEEAEECFQRVVRIIDGYREGTLEDVSNRDAEEMVRVMKGFMLERHRTNFPKANLLTYDDKLEGLFLPMSMQDFLVLDGWEPYHFRSYRDDDDVRVPSLDQFLTVWSSLGVAQDLQAQPNAQASVNQPPAGNEPEAEPGAPTDEEAPAEEGSGAAPEESEAAAPSGIGVNVNLAPAAVLTGLFDDRVIPRRFWTDLIEYRNLEEEQEEGAEETEPIYDEFGEEVLDRQAFESLEELSEVRSWDEIDPENQALLMSLLETTSDVFTIYITARRDMSGMGMEQFDDAKAKARAEEEPGGALVRTVRSVVWRREGADGMEIVTIIPWEVVETVPHEVEDYPEEY